MDTRGAVDLTVPVTRATVDADQLRSAEKVAETVGTWNAGDRPTLNPQPISFARPQGGAALMSPPQQITQLLAASVLEALLMRAAAGAFDAFGISKHPQTVTVAQLAAVTRTNAGLLGDAFEFAVADAVAQGVTDVIDPLHEGMRLLGHTGANPLGVVLVGAEKVPVHDREHVVTALREKLPALGVLRTGGPGRPPGLATALDRVQLTSWAQLTADERAVIAAANPGELPAHAPKQRQIDYARSKVSQLPRADMLVHSGTVIVPASAKINSNHVSRYGWKDVPLWLTTTAGPSQARAIRSRSGLPLVVVSLGEPLFGPQQALQQALSAVQFGLNQARLRRAGMVGLAPLNRFVDQPVVELLAELRTAVSPDVRAAAEELVNFQPGTAKVTALDQPDVLDRLARTGNSRPFVFHNQLWRPAA